MKKKSYLTGTDQFCGAGGTSTGAKAAGVEMKLALNHWDLAIETHNTNHPEVDHDCTDVQACDPRRYISTDFLYTSPECTKHSIAQGKKIKYRNQLELFGKVIIDEADERSRATMWDVPRFAEYHDYNFIIVENVVDIKNWRTYDSWLHAMHSLGYNHKSCYFNSMFFGDCPQSRDRIYVVFWKKGNKAPDLNFRPKAPCKKCGVKESYQSWKRPNRKWGKYGKKGQYIYRCSSCNEEVVPFYHAALNCIDFTIPIMRIGDRPESRTLSKNTEARIKAGLKKYKGKELVITTRHSSGIDCRIKNARQDWFPTQDTQQSHTLCLPQIHSEGFAGNISSSLLHLSTQTTRGDKTLLIPPFFAENYGASTTRLTDRSIGTITAGGVNHGLVLANYSPGYSKSLAEALPTITANNGNAILTTKTMNSFLAYYYGSNQYSLMSDAMATVTTRERSGLVIPEVKYEDCYYRTIKPSEIQRAMSFPENYIVLGNQKQKVKQLGNAVTPPVTKFITERCIMSLG